MPSPRPLLSGREFQLRYTLLRATLIARGLDPLPAEFVRVEWALEGYVADLVFEDAAGRVLEVAECKEHNGYLRTDSIREFGDIVVRLRQRPEFAGVRFRFVTNARFLPDGTDLLRDVERRAKLAGPAAADITFELGTDGKDALMALAVMHMASGVDPHGIYARLYTRLAGQMAERFPEERSALQDLVTDLHRYLLLSYEPGQPLPRGRDAMRMAIADIRSAIPKPKPSANRVSTATIQAALRRPLFDESKVALEDIFIDHAIEVRFENFHPGSRRVSESAVAVLLEWISSIRRGDPRLNGIPAVRIPLLVLGGFGTGKSSLLTVFAAKVREAAEDITPIFVSLRELIGISGARPLTQALQSFVQERYGIDILSESSGDCCLLCDGFDELEISFMHSNMRHWVEDSFRQLTLLAQRPNLVVIVSSRPVLFLGTRISTSGASSITLRSFDDHRIGEWCARYSAAAGMPPGFSLQFLAARNLVEVARTPIILYMIARIYETRKEMLEEKRYTEGDVYGLFVSWTESGGYHHDHPTKHAVPENYRQILQEIAWHFFISGETMMREDELLARLRNTFGAVVDDIPVDRNLFVAHMFQPAATSESIAAPFPRLIEFTHQSFREYLVAERTWRMLESALAGDEFAVRSWCAGGEFPLSVAEVGFLLEMVDKLGPNEARRLHTALRSAADFRQYFGPWAPELPNFETLPTRAASLATLAIILRVRLRLRMPDRPPEENEDLRALLSFTTAFASTRASVAQTQTLLLRHLSGLRLIGPPGLDRVALGGAELNYCDIVNVSFDQTLLRAVSLSRSHFLKCSFRLAELDTAIVNSTIFRDCDFGLAHISIANDLVLGTTWMAQFHECNFNLTTFERLELAQCFFIGNSWSGATVTRPLESILAGCVLDPDAWAFFSNARVQLKGCIVTPPRDPRKQRAM